jgi:hypothetical protein
MDVTRMNSRMLRLGCLPLLAALAAACGNEAGGGAASHTTVTLEQGPVSDIVGAISCTPSGPGSFDHAQLDLSGTTGLVRLYMSNLDPAKGDWTFVASLDSDGKKLQYESHVDDGKVVDAATTVNGEAAGPGPNRLEIDGSKVSFAFNATDPVDISKAKTLRFSAQVTHDGDSTSCDDGQLEG